MLTVKLFFLFGLLAVASLGSAQTPWDQGANMVRGAWENVRKTGPAAAEAAVRSAPTHFRDAQKQVQLLSKRVQKMAKDAKLEERKNLALQLWQLRGSIDLMALLNPDTLEALTGIDATMLRRMRAETAKLDAIVSKWLDVMPRLGG